ncbi:MULTISPECIES: hypothetical protein [unclassified Streptomyces]|uniref:hypothetical protein n=1 Tax=unclassified Streptomyces TaxID=2593676 RepID=UPI0036FA3F1D
MSAPVLVLEGPLGPALSKLLGTCPGPEEPAVAAALLSRTARRTAPRARAAGPARTAVPGPDPGAPGSRAHPRTPGAHA